jgi:type II secretory pathway component GspD/PulD (secretin)
MKTIAVALVSGLLSLVATAAEPTIKLTGVAQLSHGPVAILEIQPARGALLRPTLGRGEQVEGVEVTSIDAKAAKVAVSVGDQRKELSLGGEDFAGETPRFRLKDAHSRQVLDLYQELSGRTVIASPSLVAATITATSGAALEGATAAEALARALGEKGIVVIPQFDKFAFATTPALVPEIEKLGAPPARTKDVKAKSLQAGEIRLEEFSAGLIKLFEADGRQVLDIYQELTGRTLIVSPRLPAAKITLKSQTPLNRAEAIWLVEAALHLCDVAVSLRADKFAFVTTLADAPRVAKFKAPPEPTKDPKAEVFPPGLIKFNEADGAVVLDAYRQLFGQTLLPAPDLPPAKITLKSQTSLTRDEAVWLLEAALYLGGIQCVSAGDKQLKVIRDPGADANNN